MPDFDPDKWLAENAPKPTQVDHVAELQKAVSNTKAFDPDAWLAAQAAAPKDPNAFDPDKALAQLNAPQAAPRDLAAPTTQPAPQQDGPSFAPQPASGIIPSWLLPKSQQAPSPEVNVQSEEKAARQVQAGLKGNLSFNLIRAADKAVTGNSITDGWSNDTNPGILGTAVSLADPAAMGIAKAAAMVAAPLTSAIGLAGRAQKLTEFVAKVSPVAELGLENAASQLKLASKELFMNKLAQSAINGPIQFGAFEGAREAGDQLAKGEFKPSEIAGAAGKGALMGLAAGPGEVLAGKALSPLAQKLFGDQAAHPIELAETTKGKLNKTDVMDKSWSDANSRVAELVKAGTIQPEDAELFTKRQFDEHLNDAGYPLYQQTNVGTNGGINGFLNNLERFSNIDKQTGTRSYETVHNFITGENVHANYSSELQKSLSEPINALYKTGATPEQVTQWMRYVEDEPNTGDIIFNPNPLQIPGKLQRERFTDIPPSPEQFQNLQQLRATFTKTFLENPEFADKAGFVPGYVPIQAKSTGILKAGSTSRNIEDPKFLRSRESGLFDPATHEDNFGILASSYANQAAKAKAYGPHIQQLQDELTKLQFLGQHDAANELAGVAMRTMGIKQQKDLAAAFGDKFLTTHKDFLQEIANKTSDSVSTMNQIGTAVKKAIYANLVFPNPLVAIKHAVQPELVGSGEIGALNMASGRAALFNSSDRALAKQLLPVMKSLNGEALETSTFKPIENKLIKGISGVLNVTGIPGKAVLHAEDSVNRMTSFLGAYKQFNSAVKKGPAALGDVLSDMMHGEQQLVQKTLDTKGTEAAAQMYGLIKQRRIMFAYNMADRPKMFTEGVGQMIPFSTWTRNSMMRMVGDVQNGNVSSLIKRAVYPLLYLGAFKALTGYEIPNSSPALEAVNSLKMTANPVGGGVADVLTGKSSIAQGIAPFTPAGPVLRTLREYQKSDGDFFQYGLRLKPAQGSNAIERALPDVIRKALTNN